MPKRTILTIGYLFYCLIGCLLTNESRAATKHIVFVIAEDEYHADESLPQFAAQHLTPEAGFKNTFLLEDKDDKYRIMDMEQLATADLAVLYVRRRSLPAEDMARFRQLFKSGTPLLALRTSSHAWDTRGKGPQNRSEWPKFDPEVLGGNYHGHHGNQIESSISIVPGMAAHPILATINAESLTGKGSLYKAAPLEPAAQVLLIGKIPNQPAEPIFWTHRYQASKVVYTSLGHVGDFAQPAFNQLLLNTVNYLLAE